MLHMLLNLFRVRPDQKDKFKFTGFLIACIKDNKDIVEITLGFYPNIIYQKDKFGATGFIKSCLYNKKAIAKIFMNLFPNVI